MRIDLTTLQLYLAVVEEGSIARAARRAHLSGPAVSKRISELEHLLGVTLLARHSSGIRTTAAGDALAAEARSVLGTLDRLQAKLSDYAGGRRGSVTLCSGASGLVGRLPEDLKRFSADCPGVSIRVKEMHSRDVVRAVLEGEADIGIHAPHIPAPGLELHPYQAVRLVLLTPDSHPLARRRRVRLAEAARYEFLGLSEDSALGELLHAIASRGEHALNARIRVAGHEPLRRLVQAGLGVGILPEFCALPYAAAMHLACIPLSDEWARYRLSICTRASDTLSMPTRLLLAQLTSANGRPDPPRQRAGAPQRARKRRR